MHGQFVPTSLRSVLLQVVQAVAVVEQLPHLGEH